MQLTIFSKPRTTREGKRFNSYLSRIENKRTAESKTVAVQFTTGCDAPASCPCNIIVEKADVSLSEKIFLFHNPVTGEDEERLSSKLYIRKWRPGEEYIDHSMDDYFDD